MSCSSRSWSLLLSGRPGDKPNSPPVNGLSTGLPAVGPAIALIRPADRPTVISGPLPSTKAWQPFASPPAAAAGWPCPVAFQGNFPTRFFFQEILEEKGISQPAPQRRYAAMPRPGGRRDPELVFLDPGRQAGIGGGDDRTSAVLPADTEEFTDSSTRSGDLMAGLAASIRPETAYLVCQLKEALFLAGGTGKEPFMPKSSLPGVFR